MEVIVSKPSHKMTLEKDAFMYYTRNYDLHDDRTVKYLFNRAYKDLNMGYHASYSSTAST